MAVYAAVQNTDVNTTVYIKCLKSFRMPVPYFYVCSDKVVPLREYISDAPTQRLVMSTKNTLFSTRLNIYSVL